MNSIPSRVVKEAIETGRIVVLSAILTVDPALADAMERLADARYVGCDGSSRWIGCS